jgi:hypothetical protein
VKRVEAVGDTDTTFRATKVGEFLLEGLDFAPENVAA